MFSGIVTVVLLLLFLAGIAWAWSPRRKRDFDAAARLPLAEDEDKPAQHPQADGQSSPPPHADPDSRGETP